MEKKFSDSDLQNLPACAIEFIKLIIKKMRYRREVRQDVQAELAAHFEDELKDLATDDEKAQKAQQLIDGFGDVKLLAVLLRRAKKRCRPLWQTVVTRTFQTVGVLIVCFVIYVVWFLTGKPVITTDYVAELNRIVRPAADETQNAAPLYLEAAELYEKVPEDIAKLLRKKYREVTAEQKQLIEKWITDNEETLELVIAGSNKPYYWQEYRTKKEESGMMGVLIPHLVEYKNLARALRWRVWLAVEDGRYEDAFGDIKCCYRFGQHIRGDKTLVEQLVGIAIEALAIQTLSGILSEHAIDSAELAALQKDFEQMVAGEDFIVSFEAEKMCVYDEIQRCFTEDRFGRGHLYLKRFQSIGDSIGAGRLSLLELIFDGKDWTAPLHILFTHPNKQETREMLDRYYAFWAKVARKTPAQIRAEGIDTEKGAMEITKGNLLLEILTPAIGRINEIGYRIQVDIGATVTILAALRYKQNLGNYPQGLNELITSGYLKELPLDTFSGRPLVYKRTDDNFILYSVGHNFTDDGGESGKDSKGRVRQWRDNGDTVFWPVPKLQLKQ